MRKTPARPPTTKESEIPADVAARLSGGTLTPEEGTARHDVAEAALHRLCALIALAHGFCLVADEGDGWAAAPLDDADFLYGISSAFERAKADIKVVEDEFIRLCNVEFLKIQATPGGAR